MNSTKVNCSNIQIQKAWGRAPQVFVFGVDSKKPVLCPRSGHGCGVAKARCI